MFHLETVEPATLALLKDIQGLPELSETRLVGGTALALQLGHRVSVDLDVFGHWPNDCDLRPILSRCGKTVYQSGGGKLQFYKVNGVKVDCVTYDYPWIDRPLIEDGLRLASEKDIAALKINAITNRGTRKDFVDFAFLLRRHSLKEMFDWFCQKYQDTNPILAVRSLVYFIDAEEQPLPRMLVPFDWEAAKDEIRAAVRSLFGGM